MNKFYKSVINDAKYSYKERYPSDDTHYWLNIEDYDKDIWAMSIEEGKKDRKAMLSFIFLFNSLNKRQFEKIL